MSLLTDSTLHVREVLNVVNHQLATRPTSDPVAQSWARCMNEFQLDPSRFVVPPVLTDYELSSRREAMGDLIACSKLEMTTLYQQLADPELAVVLVDAGGMIVHQVSSVPFAEAVAADGFRVGALWSEREAGTNGMGTIQQGFVEGSNVQVVEEMVNMIQAQRAYEINSKAIQASDDMMQMADNLKK